MESKKWSSDHHIIKIKASDSFTGGGDGMVIKRIYLFICSITISFDRSCSVVISSYVVHVGANGLLVWQSKPRNNSSSIGPNLVWIPSTANTAKTKEILCFFPRWGELRLNHSSPAFPTLCCAAGWLRRRQISAGWKESELSRETGGLTVPAEFRLYLEKSGHYYYYSFTSAAAASAICTATVHRFLYRTDRQNDGWSLDEFML